MMAPWNRGKRSISRPEVARVRTSAASHAARSLRPEGRKVSWLPPLRFQLPPTPEEDSSQTVSPSHPLLNQSQTCTTASSSMYSRNTSRSGSRRPGTVSQSSEHSSHHRRHSPEAKRWLARSSSVPATHSLYHHRSRAVREGGKPVRPDTRPPMPPAEFWTYASKQQLHYDHSTKSEHPKTSVAPYSHKKREPSLCRYPLITPSNQPVYQTRRSTVHSETAHMHTVSYESLRKGEPRNMDEELATGARGNEVRTIANDRLRTGCSDSDTSAKRRHSKTLVKMRQSRCR